MEVKKKRHIRPGTEYDHLFPSSENDNKTIRRNANVYHTIEFIPKVVQETLAQTKKIAQLLKERSVYETCSNIWQFVYQHINYKKDQEGYEQIRSPARTWHDRTQGVDCDCYSVFISSILTNLGIPHRLRITKYHRDYFQHIYPIVHNERRLITIDCVTDKFDYEVPYSEKKDYPMDLQYLNGFDGDGMGELGKVIQRNMVKNKKPLTLKKETNPITTKKAAPALLKKIKAKTTAQPPTTPVTSPAPVPVVKKKNGILKKVVNVVNKVNPATVLLRNGILAAMKLNVKNVAQRLRWSYLTPQQIASKNIDPVKFQKLIETRQKLEKIFHGAGGKIDNLKKAILSGKGNKDKAVSGLGMLPMVDWAGYMSEYTPLHQLLGNEIYYSENVVGMSGFRGFGELGEAVTLATVGAAMGVIAGIVAALKQIGDIFKTKTKGSEDFDETKTDATENNVSVPSNSSTITTTDSTTNPILPDQSSPSALKTNSSTPSDEALLPLKNTVIQSANKSNIVLVEDNPESISTTTQSETTTSDNSNNDTPGEKESFWEKNKKWLKPVAIGVGGLTVIAIGYNLLKGKNKNKSSPASHSLSGLPFKKKKKKKHRRKSKRHHKKAIALL
jgi:hypothetical protein